MCPEMQVRRSRRSVWLRRLCRVGLHPMFYQHAFAAYTCQCGREMLFDEDIRHG